MEPSYETYSLKELVEALSSIDREAYPERVAKITAEIDMRRGPQAPKSDTKIKESSEELNDSKESDEEDQPISIFSRVLFIAAAIVMFYSSWESIVNEQAYSREGIVTLEDSPYSYYFRILIFFSMGVALLYSGFKDKVRGLLLNKSDKQ